MLIARPFVLLRFRAPEYSMDAERGIVRWRIRDGILVASEGHEGDGYLEIDLRRCPRQAPGRAQAARRGRDRLVLPAIAFRIARWVYANTQSRIHVLVTHGFLRSLAKLELEESAVGRFAPDGRGEGRRRRPARVERGHGRRHAVAARRRARRRRGVALALLAARPALTQPPA